MKDLKLMRTESFMSGDKEYEVQVTADGGQYRVQTFLQDQQVGLTYGVTFETAGDFRLYNGQSAVDTLVDIAKSAVKNSGLAINPKRLGTR